MASHSKSKVYFFFKNNSFPLRSRTALKKFIESIFIKEKRILDSINYIFCTDQDLLKINRKYLKHNYYTDIITFKLSEKNDPVIADVYISIDRVKANAVNFKTSFRIKLLRVMFHGILHLCGYQDKTKADLKLMRSKEKQYMLESLKFVSRDTVSG